MRTMRNGTGTASRLSHSQQRVSFHIFQEYCIISSARLRSVEYCCMPLLKIWLAGQCYGRQRAQSCRRGRPAGGGNARPYARESIRSTGAAPAPGRVCRRRSARRWPLHFPRRFLPPVGRGARGDAEAGLQEAARPLPAPAAGGTGHGPATAARARRPPAGCCRANAFIRCLVPAPWQPRAWAPGL